MKFPAAVAVLPDSTVIVADTGNNRLSAFSETGEYLFAIDPALPDVDQCLTPAEAGGCGLSGPTGMDVLQDGRLVVADTGNDRVLIYEADWSSVTALLGGGNLQGPPMLQWNVMRKIRKPSGLPTFPGRT